MKWFNKICKFFIKIKQDSSHFRHTETEKEAEKILSKLEEEKNFILCNNEQVPISWDNIILFNDTEGLSLPESCYRKAKNGRNPTMFVTHWDVCLSSKSCFNILKKRKLSVHFLIDNDGTIYQLMDCNDIGWHAGNRKVNNDSVGVEISNAYYPKYQELYRAKGFGPRPMWRNAKVHGRKLKPFLGFYDVQIEAFKALTKALHNAYDIPLIAPMDGENLLKTVDSNVSKGTFKGVINHYHVTERKIDCAGLKLNKILEEIA